MTDFVTAGSYILFNILNTQDFSWLFHVAIWPCFPSYIKTRNYVKNTVSITTYKKFIYLNVGIKLMQELFDRPEDEEELQYLVKCVSHHRKIVAHTKKDCEK